MKIILEDNTEIEADTFLDGDDHAYTFGDKVLGFIIEIKNHEIRAMYNKKYLKAIIYK